MLLKSNRNMKFSLIFFCFFTIINSTITLEWCPADCECQTEDNHNQAKCTSLQGILEGKNLQIHSIILSNTNLTKISHLDKLRVLTDIDVSNNHLSDIDHLGRRIKKLNLSHNKITSAKLTNIPQHVEHLDLSYNEITYLPLELTTKLKKLKTIELIGNKINCTCETLEVRNWLQSIHVSTNNFIKCSYPVQVKDLPWLQVKQKDLCDDEQNKNHDKIIDDNENELMLGDQPASDISDEKESFEELGKDYLPVEKKKDKRKANKDDEYDDEVEDGSGGGALPKVGRLLTHNDSETTTDDADDDGSGSGDIPTFLIGVDVGGENNTDTDNIFTSNEQENDTIPLIAPMEESTTQDIFSAPLGVGQLPDGETTEKHEEDVSEQAIVPRRNFETHKHLTDVDINESSVNNDENATNENFINIASPGENESRGTYILLGIILLIVVALILFVAMKRMQARRQNPDNYDAENPKSTELVSMDKKNLGKPIQKNGGGNYENKPLIGDKSKEDYAKPINGNNNNNNNRKIIDEPDHKTQEPLLNTESNNNDTPMNKTQDPDSQTKSPKTPRYGSYPPPKSPRSQGSPNSTDNEDKETPSSPGLGRYSPVYSPETGKVKIKLTETPKPKTPMLVTRSRSNAGEMITTKTTADTVDNIK